MNVGMKPKVFLESLQLSFFGYRSADTILNFGLFQIRNDFKIHKIPNQVLLVTGGYEHCDAIYPTTEVSQDFFNNIFRD